MSAVLDPKPDINLHARESRERLARMLMELFDRWEVPAGDQATLLGLSAQSRSTVARYRRGEPLADNADLLARAGHLLGIHKALRILFPHDRDLAYGWMRAPNRRFGGAAPLEIMTRHGYEGILAVRRYLDFERGR
ncbi:MAG TPA: MbcA/ParS/Xre antitoxin family protein [Burkholderiales bacterium]|nr:MbcA/ParS/Xre antitoxin family protein [Burkholderiales bacterium]